MRPIATLVAGLALVACTGDSEPFGLDVDSRVIESASARAAHSTAEVTIVACDFGDIASNTGPVWFVDGIERTADDAAVFDLTPDDILDITVLKGDEAVARFGQRVTAGGAVLIRTTARSR